MTIQEIQNRYGDSCPVTMYKRVDGNLFVLKDVKVCGDQTFAVWGIFNWCHPIFFELRDYRYMFGPLWDYNHFWTADEVEEEEQSLRMV